MTDLLEDGVGSVVEEPQGADRLCGAQLLQVHEEGHAVEAQQGLCQGPHSAQVCHQLQSVPAR